MRKLRGLLEVEVDDAPIERFRLLVDDQTSAQLTGTMARLVVAMRGRKIWNVNSTARGGGVAEMLAALIPYSRGCGVDERWVVIDGSPEFFEVTKTLHNLLHGVKAEGASLSDEDRRRYAQAAAENAAALLDHASPGDVAILHDPQTAGLAPPLRERGVRVVWRSHVGVDVPNDAVREAWDFLLTFVRNADTVVFSRRAYVWEGLEQVRVEVIPPCIDPFAAKNRDLEQHEVQRILQEACIELPRRFVLQVSRWDRLKDPAGVMQAFARHVAPRVDAHLVLAGPETTSVTDDPEQQEVLGEVMRVRESLQAPVRDRVVVSQLPMDDVERNALMVNALQRRAAVVVQKSLAEGFGLTVAEAMWKAKPVVASRVGGIGDQIEHRRSGLLVDDPTDLTAFGDAVVDLLTNEAMARSCGEEARRRVGGWYITPCHLIAQGALLLDLVSH
jgi:trehalose synthase